MRISASALVFACLGCGVAFDARDDSAAGGAQPTATTAQASVTSSSGAVGGEAGGTTSTAGGSPGGTGGGAPRVCHPAGLIDAFDTALDDAMWNRQGAQITSVYGGALHIDPLANQSSDQWSGVVTSESYDVTMCAVWIEAPSVVHPQQEGSTYWQLYHPEGTVSVTVRQSELVLHVDGTEDDVVLPYDEAAHRWWRIREAAGTTHLETSADGSLWIGHHQGRTPAFIADVTLGLGRVSAGNVAAPGETVVDNLNVAP